MKVEFANLENAVISMDEFSLKWRFTDGKCAVLPTDHLNQLKPLNSEASKFLSDHIGQVHSDFPFTNKFFNVVDRTDIIDENEVRKWLYRRGIPFKKEVYLSWSSTTAMIVPWKLLIKYFDKFYYSVSDDLTVFDESLSWALLFFHTDEVYFGTNQGFII